MIQRRNFLTKLIATTGSILFANSVLAKPTKPEIIKGKFVHSVFFWLAEGENPDEFIASTITFLRQVSSVRSYHVGKPAMTPREVVDNSYSICLVVTFDDVVGHDIYQAHPAQVAFVEANKHRWTGIKIYDSIML